MHCLLNKHANSNWVKIDEFVNKKQFFLNMLLVLIISNVLDEPAIKASCVFYHLYVMPTSAICHMIGPKVHRVFLLVPIDCHDRAYLAG